MTITKKNNKYSLNRNDFFPFLEGLDLFINLSLITYLCAFFLPSFELRNAIIILTTIVLFSIITKVTLFRVFEIIHNKLRNPNLLVYLMFAYILVIVLPKELFVPLGLIVFSFSRVIIGSIFSAVNIKYTNNILIYQKMTTKYWIILFLGILFGSLLVMITNEIFSNSQLNLWAWKVPYVCYITLLTFLFFITKGLALNNSKLYDITIENIKKPIGIFNILENLHYLIPTLTIILFSTSIWLPKFSNPENMQFLQYDFLYLTLSLTALIFISPLSKLIGYKGSIRFFYISSIITSVICLFVEHTSSYSINFAKLFLSLLSSYSICLIILRYNEIKTLSLSQKNLLLNFINLISILIIPIIFYTFINITINYNILYFIITIIMITSYLAYYYGNKR